MKIELDEENAEAAWHIVPMRLSRWLALGALVGVIAGAASALFLFALQLVTDFRTGHELIVYGLPVAGLLVGWVYERFGRSIAGGANLIIDTIHDDGPCLPLRMAPMVLIGTVLTHLFGGSAGREGTAVQMGASLADTALRYLRLTGALRRQVLAAGVAGGFGSVFGTPVAGALFGLEFVVQGRIEYAALLPALSAAVIGDLTTRALGINHSVYPTPSPLALSPLLLLKWLVFAIALSLATRAFVELTHFLKAQGARWIPRLPLRMFVGGVVVVALWRSVGTSDYLGLGVPTILRSFTDANLPMSAFALKILFTALTLGAGFLGGEVTPLFFVGAALGNVLARALGLPLAMGAGVGLAAVFAAAAKTPLALSVMAVELLGGSLFPHAAIVCALCYLITGRRGIYSAQRVS
ncbi:MAG TPA: chloride channel protein [Polyangiaceae bacterium]|nr:chloride channel protein [Polyangiaceae bacterium]